MQVPVQFDATPLLTSHPSEQALGKTFVYYVGIYWSSWYCMHYYTCRLL